MSHRRLLVVGLLLAAPRFAAAQFATLIPPRQVPKVVEPVKTKPVAVASTKKAIPSAPLQRIRLAPMKIWVDSAIGIRSSSTPTTKPPTSPPPGGLR